MWFEVLEHVLSVASQKLAGHRVQHNGEGFLVVSHRGGISGAKYEVVFAVKGDDSQRTPISA
jgi:hypothetical protein